MQETLKKYKREIFFIFIIFFVSSISFALGYVVHEEFSRTPIIIEKCGTTIE